MWEIIRANRRRSIFLVAGMSLLLAVMGYAFGEVLAEGGGVLGLAVAAAIATFFSIGSLAAGDRVLLAVSGARKVTRAVNPRLVNIVEEMTIASGLPTPPEIYIIEDDGPNAFATGRGPERAAVAVTSGLLARLDRDELQGVIAHEIGHVKNRDILFMTLLSVMAGVIVILADVLARSLLWGGRYRSRSSRRSGGSAEAILLLVGIAMAVLAPILAQLIYFAASRRREYLADASGALFTRYPEGLASALEKIAGSPVRARVPSRALAPLYIVNPLKGGARAARSLMATHPPIGRRIAILRAMGKGAGFAEYERAFQKVTGGGSALPASAVRDAVPVSAREAGEEAEREDPRARARAAMDLVWAASGYLFLTCPCGVKLKVPPSRRGRPIGCPRCGRTLGTGGEKAGGGPCRPQGAM